MNDKLLCIYHGNCADGFASAWAVRRAFGRDNVEFHAGAHYSAPPIVTGRDVVIVDFSYKRPILEEMARSASSVTVIDHHASVQQDLQAWIRSPQDMAMDAREFAALCHFEGSLPLRAMFNMERSGCGLVWDHYFPNEAPPPLLLALEDRDLARFDKEPWKTLRPLTREVQANVFSLPYDFELYDGLMENSWSDYWLRGFAKDGAAIERKHFKDIAELLKVVTRRMNIAGYNVPIANLPYTFVADAAHALAQNEPFAGCYWDTPGNRIFGLRSTESGVDVSAVASYYGGGGHVRAAGFRLSFAEAAQLEVA